MTASRYDHSGVNAEADAAWSFGGPPINGEPEEPVRHKTNRPKVDCSFYVELLCNVLADAYACYAEIPRREFDRDVKTIRTRVAAEGFGFLTKTLPQLGKALDKGLETGSLVCPPAFARKSKSGRIQNIPTFMSALFRTIFDSVSGRCVPCKDNALGHLRQVCYLAYKVEFPMSPLQLERASSAFIETDLSLKPLARLLDSKLLRNVKAYLERLFIGFKPDDIRPRHGPGVVADRKVGRDKWSIDYFVPTLDCLYPYASYLTGGVHTGSLDSLIAHCKLPWADDHPPARVVFVPKDSRGPRTISCEPAQLQFLQQGLGRAIVHWLEHSPLTKGRLNFSDQSINQRLALESSRNRLFCTLDMKDASDRVSLDAVWELFPEPLRQYLRVLRSATTALPNGKVVVMKKYAPMGSALCFPVEACIFYAIATVVVGMKTQQPAGRVESVFVYGDDIIVPTEFASDIIKTYEILGFRMNRDKCCVQGFFRESCGMDAYHGVDVTPVKVRCLVQQGRCHRSVLYRLSQNAKAFFDKGYWRTSEFLWSGIERILGKKLPVMSDTFPGICRSSSVLPLSCAQLNGWRRRWNRDYQRLEIRTFYLSSRKVRSVFPTDHLRLFNNLISGCERPYDDNVAVSAGSALPKTSWAVVS